MSFMDTHTRPPQEILREMKTLRSQVGHHHVVVQEDQSKMASLAIEFMDAMADHECVIYQP